MPLPKIHPIVLSGGSGTRLWPLSRELFPKQFHRLTGPARTLLQDTIQRYAESPAFAPAIVVSNEAHRFVLGAQLQEIEASVSLIMLEPCARGTAAAIAAAALSPHAGPNDLMIAAPTDHYIGDPDAFRRAVLAAAPAAQEGRIVVFGLTPSRAETGYGYIQAGLPLNRECPVRASEGFVEKPDAVRAQALAASGEHFWNLGMFLFRKSALLEELSRHAPNVLAAAENAITKAKRGPDFLQLDPVAFAAAPSISIDYALMEKTANGAVMPVSFAWSDLGAWNSLWDAKKDASPGSQQTVTVGDVHAIDVARSYIRSDAGLVVAIGVSDLVVVSSGDATLVAPMDRAREVGAVVEKLRSERRREARNHLLVHRPWGHFLTLAEGPGYQVKVLTLDPKASISLQFHKHRAERWVVVEGEADVMLDGQTYRLREHESVEIGRGQKHRLSNPGDRPLKVIEVQSGDYLGEDDIVRLD